jgi:hypothetical protein
MGPIKLDKTIMGTMKTWGGNYDSTVGNNHCGVADKIDQKIDSKSVTLNTEMDPNRAKPSNMNPGNDRGFVMGKGSPVMDTTGHGKLTKSLQD